MQPTATMRSKATSRTRSLSNSDSSQSQREGHTARCVPPLVNPSFLRPWAHLCVSESLRYGVGSTRGSIRRLERLQALFQYGMPVSALACSPTTFGNGVGYRVRRRTCGRGRHFYSRTREAECRPQLNLGGIQPSRHSGARQSDGCTAPLAHCQETHDGTVVGVVTGHREMAFRRLGCCRG